MRRWNWFLWGGLALDVIAFLSYPILFSRWPATRDVPWVNYILFAIAIALLVAGLRRANREHRVLRGAIPTFVGVAIAALFVFGVSVLSKQMPSAHPIAVGQKAPDFTMRDTNGRSVTLAQLAGAAPHGVLLVFYRGYW